MEKMKRAFAVMQLRVIAAILVSLAQDYSVTKAEAQMYNDIWGMVDEAQGRVENAKEME